MQQAIEYDINVVKRIPQNYSFEEKINVLGICGREGAGKTTIANILTNQNGHQYELRLINDPIDYICDVIFGTEDLIWTLTREQQRRLMENFITVYVDREWVKTYGKTQMFAPFDITGFSGFSKTKTKTPTNSKTPNDNWVEFSMATPLKKVCSVIFQMPYEVLLAQTPGDRVLRENIIAPINSLHYKDDTINGRVALEYFGTDVMRNLFDTDIWLKIMQREAAAAIASGKRVVIPDIRFENEMNLINSLGGTLLVVCRDINEINITDADRKTHPSKWNFIDFYKNAKKYYVFLNVWPLEVLPSKILKLTAT